VTLPPDRSGRSDEPIEPPASAPDPPASGADLAVEPADTPPEPEPPGAPAAPARPGLTTFTIEGRAAPGLFVVGWLGTLLGLGIVVVAYGAGPGATSSIVLIAGLALLSLGLVSAAGSQAIERRTRGEPGYTGPSPVLLFAASVPVASLAAAPVGLVLRALGFEMDGPVVTLILLAVLQLTYVAVIRLLVVGTGALRWSEMGLHRDPRRAIEDLAWGAVIAGPVLAGTLIVTALLVSVFQVAPESPLPPSGTTTGLIVNLVAAALLVPIGEELLFRGVATTAWARTLGARAAIIRGGLFFAVVHVLQIAGTSAAEALALVVVGFGARLPVGLALGWAFLRRGSLYTAIGLHAAFNGFQIILADLAARSLGGG
jgi:membrane protease YdiL (CAAX protease family)